MRAREPVFAALRLRMRHLFWRHVRRHVSGWLDRRFHARHLREYGWPMRLGMGPFSSPEDLWHHCPDGHSWERIDWPYGRAIQRGHRPDRVTRCRKCGAPRCDSYYGPGAMSDLTENEQEAQRCTFERHHTKAHDYLSGVRIDIGGGEPL